jgi:hypothetical protein
MTIANIIQNPIITTMINGEKKIKGTRIFLKPYLFILPHLQDMCYGNVIILAQAPWR